MTTRSRRLHCSCPLIAHVTTPCQWSRLGRITAVSTQASASAAVQPFISAIQYNALGQPLGWTWFNGDSASRSYDTAARPSASEIASVTYDEDGRITGIVQHQVNADGTQPHSNSHSIGYDNRDRLTSFAMTPGAGSSEAGYSGYSQTYSYDNNNNRTASTDVRTTAQGNLNTLQGWTLQSASNRLNQRSELSTLDGAIQTSRTDSYTLDAAGNQSDDGWQRFQYDALNRLSRSIGTSHSVLYLHNALGQRSFKSAPKPESLNTPVGSLSGWIGQWVPWAQGGAIVDNLQRQGTAFMYDEAGQLLGEYLHDGSNPNSQSGEYIWLPRPDGGSELVGYVKSQGSNSQRYAVHSDHLGTPRRITNESGQPVWQWAYSAYGDNAAQVLAAAEPGFEFNPRFPGQYFDSESGKHYNYFRTYDPKTGRYTQSDPIGLEGGWNRFAYVEGDPVSMIDPMGLMGSGGNHSPRSNDHNYEWTTFRCMGDCREQTMRELRCNPAPGVTSAGPTETGAVNTVKLAGMKLGDITTAVSPTTNTTWNLTMPGHLLHPGWVRRDVVYDGKATWIVNTGGGTGFNPLNLNTLLAPIVWGGSNPSRLPAGEGCSCGK